MLENETFYFYLTRDVLLSYSFFFFLFYCFVSFRFFARGGERERGKFYPLILNRIKISSRIIRCVDVKFFLICFSYVLINIFFFFLLFVARKIRYSWLPTFEIFFLFFLINVTVIARILVTGHSLWQRKFNKYIIIWIV